MKYLMILAIAGLSTGPAFAKNKHVHSDSTTRTYDENVNRGTSTGTNSETTNGTAPLPSASDQGTTNMGSPSDSGNTSATPNSGSR